MVRLDNFKQTLLDEHDFTMKSFDSFVEKSKANYLSSREEQRWDDYCNNCSSISGFVSIIPERSEDFKDLIVPLIKIISDKTDKIRKNSAVLLAKLSQNENNKRIMQANHGTEVLASVQSGLMWD